MAIRAFDSSGENDSVSQAHICPNEVMLRDILKNGVRLRPPIERAILGWEKIAWGEA